MRNCPKCGKANAVTRKYCVRCGSPLMKTVESIESETPEPPTEEPAAEPEPVTSPPAGSPSVSDEERHVRPSEVARDRMRTAERHVEKTELEKAKEAFARSEETEERMLRASELRELQAEVHKDSEPQPPPTETIPNLETPGSPGDTAPSPPPTQTESSQVEYEEGKEVVKQILKRVKEAETRSKAGTEAHPPGDSTVEKSLAQPGPPAGASRPPIISESLVETPKTSEAQPTPASAPSPVSLKSMSEPITDTKVRQYETDIKALEIEKGQLETELVSLQNRLDEEVERLRIDSETRRTKAEGIERELRLAKKEYKDAKKELKRAEKRRKKEISNAKKRIKSTDKKMKKARKAREKRLSELEKERLKREAEG